jgi:hypothetical protein
MAMPEGGYSAESVPENDASARVTSPRSLKACAKEGVDPKDLIFRPVEEFAEPGMEPRLVRLRFEFFDAKRRDLLTLVKRSRTQLVSKEERQAALTQGGKSTSSSPELRRRSQAADGHLIVAAASAKESDTIALEKHKLARVQANERKWLQSALGSELQRLRDLEAADQRMSQETADGEKAADDDSKRKKEQNEKKRQEEAKKAAEQAAILRLERQLAKEQFEREQEEMQLKARQAALEKKRALERGKEEAERKKQMDQEKQAAQERAWQRQQERIQEMQEKDAERRRVMEAQKKDLQDLMRQKIDAKNDRIQKSIENNMELERQKEEALEMQMLENMERQARLEEEKRLNQQQAAKRSLHQYLKRKEIADNAAKEQEDRRQEVLRKMEEVEARMMDHDMKKERYLEFKRELDMLKEKNKELNVQRMRRRQEYRREQLADEARKKAAKADFVQLERQRLYDDRRRTASMSQLYRDRVREIVHVQKLRSEFDSSAVEGALRQVFSDPSFNPQTPKVRA